MSPSGLGVERLFSNPWHYGEGEHGQETELSGRQLDPWGHALEPGPGTREAGFPFGFYEASSPPECYPPTMKQLGNLLWVKMKVDFLKEFWLWFVADSYTSPALLVIL